MFAKLAGARVIVLDVNGQRLDFCKRRHGRRRDDRARRRRSVDDLRRRDRRQPARRRDRRDRQQRLDVGNAFGYVAPTGRLVYVGITTKEVTFTHPTFHRPEGTLLCSRNALPADFTRIIELIETGKIDTKPWITHRTSFDELPGVFESYTKPETGVIKAVVEV